MTKVADVSVQHDERDLEHRNTPGDRENEAQDDGISLKTCEEFERYGPTRDVVITNCTIVWASRHGSFAHAVEAVDVTGLVIEGLRGTAAHPGQQAVLIKDRGPGEIRYPAVVSG